MLLDPQASVADPSLFMEQGFRTDLTLQFLQRLAVAAAPTHSELELALFQGSHLAAVAGACVPRDHDTEPSELWYARNLPLWELSADEC